MDINPKNTRCPAGRTQILPIYWIRFEIAGAGFGKPCNARRLRRGAA